ARDPEVGVPGPGRHPEADRDPGGAGGQGGRRLPPGRQDAPEGGSPGVPPGVHLRDQGREAPRPGGGAQGEDGLPGGLQVRVAGAAMGPGTALGATPAPILETEALTVRFGGLTALRQVSLAVPAGEIRAIIGPNGAGKSTLFNCLTGVLAPTEGRIRFAGEDVTRLPPRPLSRRGRRPPAPIT